MSEYFIKGNTFAAPFASDPVERYIEADNPLEGLKLFVEEFSHPMGLYFASIFNSADDYHKKREPLYHVWSNQAEYNWQGKDIPQNIDPKELVFSAKKEW